jgi:MFS transporter, DHA2 family, methylenomycin A resistance protein
MRRHLPLLAICLGYFMVILDATIVNVALPSIARDLGGGVGSLQWVIDAYTVVFAGLLLSAGSIGDLVGSRKVLDTGLALFTAASAACAVAPSVGALVGARVAQGVGAALMVPSSLALLRAAYPDVAERARAVGAWGAVAGVAAASGPILGGVLVTIADWRVVFVVNLPVGLLAMWLSYRHLPKAGERSDAGLDPAGQVLGVLTLTLLTLGLIEGGSSGWGSPLALIGLIGFVPALLGFLAVERNARHPMLPLNLFSNRTFSGATFVGLAINLGFYGELFALSLYFQRVRGFSALETGLALLPEGVFVAVSSMLSGRLTSRIGPRVPMLGGLLVGASGFAALIVAGRSTPYTVLVPGLVAVGIGMAFTMPAATAATIESAPADRAGIASGVLNAARQAGGAIGVALLGTLLAGSAFVSGLHLAMAASAASFLTGAAVAALVVDRLPRRQRVAHAECREQAPAASGR